MFIDKARGTTRVICLLISDLLYHQYDKGGKQHLYVVTEVSRRWFLKRIVVENLWSTVVLERKKPQMLCHCLAFCKHRARSFVTNTLWPIPGMHSQHDKWNIHWCIPSLRMDSSLDLIITDSLWQLRAPNFDRMSKEIFKCRSRILACTTCRNNCCEMVPMF